MNEAIRRSNEESIFLIFSPLSAGGYCRPVCHLFPELWGREAGEEEEGRKDESEEEEESLKQEGGCRE